MTFMEGFYSVEEAMQEYIEFFAALQQGNGEYAEDALREREAFCG